MKKFIYIILIIFEVTTEVECPEGRIGCAVLHHDSQADTVLLYNTDREFAQSAYRYVSDRIIPENVILKPDTAYLYCKLDSIAID